MIVKKYSKCKGEKPLSDFYKHKRGRSGVVVSKLPISNELRQELLRNKPSSQEIAKLKHKKGKTLNELIWERLSSQNRSIFQGFLNTPVIVFHGPIESFSKVDIQKIEILSLLGYRTIIR